MSDLQTTFDVVAALRARGSALGAGLQAFLDESAVALARASELIVASLAGGGTIFTCGNGGSAAHATHLEAELVGRYRADRRPLPSIYLGMSAPSSSAIANDYAAELVFRRPLQALGGAGDALVAFSTSGTSPNVVQALGAARAQEIASVLVTGPGASADVADVVLRFPGGGADAIQDGHDLILHALMDAIEAAFAPADAE